MSFRRLTIALLVTSILLVSTTCSLTLASPEKPTLVVIGPWAGPERDRFLPVLKAAEVKLGINIEYRIMRSEEAGEVLPAYFRAGKTPGDVILIAWPWWIKKNYKHLVDLTDIAEPEKYKKGLIDLVTVDGKVYGLPYTGKIKPGFWYRISFFKKHGLKVPTTWDEFVALLKEIKTKIGIIPIASGDGVGWPLSDVTEHFILRFAGLDVFKKLVTGEVRFTDPVIRSVFRDRLVPLLKAGYFSAPEEWTTILKRWWKGDHALYFMGSWITEMVPDPEDLGLLPLPGTKVVVIGVDFAFVPKYSKHVKEAKELAKFLCGVQGQSIQVIMGGHIATRVDVPLAIYPPVDRKVAEVLVKAEAVAFDLDDTIGGKFQSTFWDQLKYLWVHPEEWESVLRNIEAAQPKP